MSKLPLAISSLGIGHGDATLITLRHGSTQWNCLVDGGESPARLASALDNVWEKHGNTRREIDLLIVSHFDSDHLAGLLGLTANYVIAEYYAPMLPAFQRHRWLFGARGQSAFDRAAELEEEIDGAGGHILYPLEGFASQPLGDGRLAIEVLSPPARLVQRLLAQTDISALVSTSQTPLGWLVLPEREQSETEAHLGRVFRSMNEKRFAERDELDDVRQVLSPQFDPSAIAAELGVEPEYFGDNLLNNSSLVVRISVELEGRYRSVLLTGDQENWTYIYARHRGGLRVDVLKAPHHGGHLYLERDASHDEFFRFTQPTCVLISASGRYALPSEQIRSAAITWGSTVLCTNERGIESIEGDCTKSKSCFKCHQCRGEGNLTVSLEVGRDAMSSDRAACHSGQRGLRLQSPVVVSQHFISPSGVLAHLAGAELDKHIRWLEKRLAQLHGERKRRDRTDASGAEVISRDTVQRWAIEDDRRVVLPHLDRIIEAGFVRRRYWANLGRGGEVYAKASHDDLEAFARFLSKLPILVYRSTLQHRNRDVSTLLNQLSHSHMEEFVDRNLGFPRATFEILYRPLIVRHLRERRHLYVIENGADSAFVFIREADLATQIMRLKAAQCIACIHTDQHGKTILGKLRNIAGADQVAQIEKTLARFLPSPNREVEFLFRSEHTSDWRDWDGIHAQGVDFNYSEDYWYRWLKTAVGKDPAIMRYLNDLALPPTKEDVCREWNDFRCAWQKLSELRSKSVEDPIMQSLSHSQLKELEKIAAVDRSPAGESQMAGLISTRERDARLTSGVVLPPELVQAALLRQFQTAERLW